MKNQTAKRKIFQREIFSTAHAELINSYKTEVLTKKTRHIRLLGRKSPARILNTLLGFEVQASYKRIQCPDLVTARYIRLFSELGCHSIMLPYDPTLTAKLIPQFEEIIGKMTDRIKDLFPSEPTTQQYVIRKVFGMIRKDLKEV